MFSVAFFCLDMWYLFFDGNYRFNRKLMGIGLNVIECEGLERFHKVFCGKGCPIRYEYTVPLFSCIFITK